MLLVNNSLLVNAMRRVVVETPVVRFSKTDDRLSRARVQYDDDEKIPFGETSAQQYDDDEATPYIPTATKKTQVDPKINRDRQGSIRIVADAHLVYKRRDESNQFTELWVFKENKRQKMMGKILNAIIAGTDIQQGRKQSIDGVQRIETWEIGPPENTIMYVEITGLQN